MAGGDPRGLLDQLHLGWLNDLASLIAAAIGIIISVKACEIDGQINRLNENLETSTLLERQKCVERNLLHLLTRKTL